ncbi:MAG: response regulator [Lachnospiraceae bacterium]|nr:response regulator [Lachnospiraceae bacterium]
MEKQKNRVMKFTQCILGILMVSAFAFFILGEVFLPRENVSEHGECRIFRADWSQVMPNGEQMPIEVPGNCETGHGEWVTIVTTLASDSEDTWLCVRSMQQELNIFVGDELRKEYSTLDTQPFGKTSTMTYVFFPIYESDAGKQLRIEFMSDSNYAGFVSDIYEGDLADIKQYFYGKYAPSAVVAAFMLIISVFVIAGSVFVKFFFKRDVEVLYLGIVILIASMWLLVESKIRQFVFPNTTVAMLMGFLMVALLPYPFLSYVNSVQKGRYQKAYMVIGICTAINYVAVVLLQVLNIKDFFETMTSSHIIILVLIVTMGVTAVLDIVRGYVREYREVAVGFAILMAAGVFEIALTYVVDTVVNGISLCFGLVILLFSAGLKSIRDLLNVEKEKQMAIAMSQSKAKFLANMSHEIRTPINTVIGMNEMILRENKDETIDEYATNIKQASQMLLGLINDVLDFSKIEAGKLELVEDKYSLATMLNDVIIWNEERAKKKGLEIKLDIDETLPAVLKGDELRIKQILNNLLSNAIKYTDNGSIEFTVQGVRDENGFALIMSVADTGKGIKKEDLERLFDSFQRLELNKNRYIEGSGLGLNITKQLVDCMNGTIRVQSVYGEGSCFTVEIPQEIIDMTAMGKLGEKPKPAVETPQKQEICYPDAKVLVVDDNKMNLKVVEALLKRSKIQLDFATGGNESFTMTKEKKYDLIFMDHMMPEPDGVQTLHMIRNDKDNPNLNTPVVVLTANAIEGMREQYLTEGFDNFLSKPINFVEFEKMLEEYLRRS